MKEYFKPTLKKILGTIILVFLLSFIGFFLEYISNPSKFVLGQQPITLGFPLNYVSIGGTGISNLNILNLIIDIIIFYLIVCVLSIVFRGRKKENVPSSNSGGGNTSPPDQTQPGN